MPACEINRPVRLGALAGAWVKPAAAMCRAKVQKKLDVIANDVLIAALKAEYRCGRGSPAKKKTHSCPATKKAAIWCCLTRSTARPISM